MAIAKIQNEKQLQLKQIKETPFNYASNGEKNYITCGKVLYETEKTEEEAIKWINEMPWDAIGVFTQALIYELTNLKNN